MAFLKDGEKQLLLDYNDDIEWFGDVTKQQCVRCHRVAINHYVSNCQHLFCDHCKKELENGGQLKCPQCQECVTKMDDQDFDVEVKMHKLKIFCPNKKYGCKYADQLRTIPSHLMTCMDRQEEALSVGLPVSNTMDDVVKQLTNLNGTVALLRGRMIKMNNMVQDKLNQLERKTDYLDSKINVLTDRMTNGDKKVEERSLKMELASMTYTEESQSMKLVLESINERIEQNESLFQEKMEQMRVKMASMTLEMEALHYNKLEELKPTKAETYEWPIQWVSLNVHREKWEFQTPPFQFAGYKFEIRAKMTKQDGKLVIYLQFQQGNTINKFINNDQFTTVRYTVRDQSDFLAKKDISREVHHRFYDRFVQYGWILTGVLPDEILLSPYVKNDRIKITISFEYPSVDRSFVSNNGILKWRVDNYKRRKEDQINLDTWSPTFYTSPQGYRVKTKLLANSSLLYVNFLTGEHDDSLSKDFPHMTTVTLINQTDPWKNSVKSVQCKELQGYLIQLDSIKSIEENGFIKDDSLLLKVVIEPIVRK